MSKTQSKPSQDDPQYISCQPTSVLKMPKKQRMEANSENNDSEQVNRDREDVQSPAYSDISDDSTPVFDSENVKEKVPTEKRQSSTIAVKKPADVLPQQSQMTSMGGYNMYPFYPHPQPPYMMQQPPQGQQIGSPNNSSSPKSPTPQTDAQTTAQDFSKNKNAMMDLMTKAPQPNIKESNKSPTPPLITPSKFMPNYYQYK